MSTHTSGPWVAYSPSQPGDFGNGSHWEIEDSYGHTATVYGEGPEAEANALLIARSPEMHLALSLIAGIAGLDLSNGNSEPDDMAESLDRVHNALAEIQGIVRKAIAGLPLAISPPLRWIPITESLPDEDISVLVRTDEGAVAEAYLSGGDWFWPGLVNPISAVAVTHWAEMPDGPDIDS
jgi:hypothetical protein